jgi:hypothetical protein
MNSLDHFRYIVKHEADLLLALAPETGNTFVRKALADSIEELNERLRKVGGAPVDTALPQSAKRGFTVVALRRVDSSVDTTNSVGALNIVKPLGFDRQIDTSSVCAMDQVVVVVAAALNLSPERVMQKTRERRYSYARQMCMHLAYFVFGISSTQIAQYFGKKDHTTALYGRDRIQDDLDTGKIDLTLWRDLTARVREIGRRYGLVFDLSQDEPLQLALPA